MPIESVYRDGQTAQAIFTEIGPVELKGVSGVIRLYAVHHAACWETGANARRPNGT